MTYLAHPASLTPFICASLINLSDFYRLHIVHINLFTPKKKTLKFQLVVKLTNSVHTRLRIKSDKFLLPRLPTQHHVHRCLKRNIEKKFLVFNPFI